MNQNQGKSGSILKAGMWACGLLALACLCFGAFEWAAGRHEVTNFHDLTSLGNYGSFLQGTVASLWALAGVFLIVMAFLGSQQQLALQREQLATQDKQLNDQLQTMKRQRFEDSFFQMLNLQQQVVASLTTQPNSTGREVFGYLYGVFDLNFKFQLAREFNIPIDMFGIPTQPLQRHMDKPHTIQYYEQFYRFHEAEFGHYFRTLYHLIKFVKQSDIDDKRRYTSLVRAQLSKYELFFLFYNCLRACLESGEGSYVNVIVLL